MGAEEENPPIHTLHAGELLFGKGRYIISTLLGSCVSVTLFHPKKSWQECVILHCRVSLPMTEKNRSALCHRLFSAF